MTCQLEGLEQQEARMLLGLGENSLGCLSKPGDSGIRYQRWLKNTMGRTQASPDPADLEGAASLSLFRFQ